MVREISKNRKIPMKQISAVVIFFMIIGIILILVGFYVLLWAEDPLSYLNLSYSVESILPAGAAITFLAVIGGTVATYRRKIISETYIIIFVIIFISGITIYSVGLFLYHNGWSTWSYGGGIPPMPDTVKNAGNLVLIGGVIAILDIVSAVAVIPISKKLKKS